MELMIYLILLVTVICGMDCWASTCPPFVETYEGRYD